MSHAFQINNTLTCAFTWAQAKLPPPGYENIIAKGNYVRCLVLKLPPRKG
jgi:hypothetical protein